MKSIPKIVITPGEPAGIGYDIILDISKKSFAADLISIASIELLKERRDILKKKVNFIVTEDRKSRVKVIMVDVFLL